MKLIGAATGLGAQDPASGKGADFLFENAKELKNYWKEIVRTGQNEINNNISFAEKVNYLFPFYNKINKEVKDILREKDFPVVVGGDHSCAIGTWRALLETSKKEVGLLWLDAHLDAHTIETTPSYAIHGMPLACLLGYGDQKFIPNRVLLPENLVIFGARSWEKGERDLLDFLNVRIYEMDEINSRGMGVCLQEALDIVAKPELDFGISLDLDMFEPEIIQGVCSREKDGILPQYFFDVFKDLKIEEKKNFKAFEIVEFAPDRDVNGKTFEILRNFINLMSGSVNKKSKVNVKDNQVIE